MSDLGRIVDWLAYLTGPLLGGVGAALAAASLSLQRETPAIEGRVNRSLRKALSDGVFAPRVSTATPPAATAGCVPETSRAARMPRSGTRARRRPLTLLPPALRAALDGLRTPVQVAWPPETAASWK